MSKEKVVTVKIQGNGAIKHDGQYIYYKKNEPVDMPESVAKRTGREYEVIPQSKVKKAVVTNSEKKQSAVSDQLSEEQYPKHTGGGWYELSNGERVQGKESAIEAEEALES